MKEIFTFDSTTITHRTVNTKEIEGTDFVFYEDCREINEDGVNRTEVYKGITSLENIKNITGMKDIKKKVKAPNMYKGKANVGAIEKAAFEKLKAGDLELPEVVKDIDYMDYSEETHVLVLYSFDGTQICDLNHRFISIPIHFGYIGTEVDNYTYDLVRLLERLKNDEHVCHKDQLEISSIPYYNRFEGKEKCIEFDYLLPDDVYNTLALEGKINEKVYILDNIIGAKEFKKPEGIRF